ncbi:MAG TPA: hypothetical protein VM055_06920 [Novosphingobium sp.]|nr:hypothetical protein [Novosphingobium sp.]
MTALLLAACSREPTAAEIEAQERRDIAEVEAVQKQKPPPQMIAPEPILYPDIEQNDLFGAGCAFAPGDSIGAVLLTRDKTAWMKVEGVLVRFASDPGSAKMPLGTWSRYSGKEMALALTKAEAEGEPSGEETTRWRGHLTVTDPFDQVIYDQQGLMQCGA